MKIIDLLNKIAKGEEVPKKIKYQFKTFELSDNEVYLRTDKVKDYDYGWKTLFQYILECDLNDEIEIIEEEKEIKEIPIPEIDDAKNERILRAEFKINELVREFNKIKKEGK